MSLLRGIFEGIRRVGSYSTDPFRVIEVNDEDYIYHQSVCHDECLVLYRSTDKEVMKLEIVMQIPLNHSSKKSFSLHRTEDEVEAQVVFCQLRDKLPLLVECNPDLGLNKMLLQEVSQAIRENPTWTTTHIASRFGYIGCFKNNIVLNQLNHLSEKTFETPLHVAVKFHQNTSVAALMSLDARMDIVDVNGDTVLHHAAITTKETIQALTVKSVVAIINAKNNQGCTPLHLACMADKPECVIELLKAGADVNLACVIDDPKSTIIPDDESTSRSMKEVVNTFPHQFFVSDIKNGGTPLHWSKTPELMEALIEFGCNVDARNFQGDTALHMMIRRYRLSCAVVLLSHEANLDVQGADGNTPLHLAVKSGDISLVHTLIAFGANLNILNSKGETPRHIVATEKKTGYGEMLYALHIIGAKRCTKCLGSCNEGCNSTGHFNGVPPENSPSSGKYDLFDELLSSFTCTPDAKKSKPCICDEMESCCAEKRCRVLTLDGGGIRGLVLIQILYELEKVLGVPLVQCFDWVSGTSTGGILALVLANGKSVKSCRCLYFRLKDKVFVGARPYDAELLETFLKDELGSTTVMADITSQRVMVTATRGDRKPADLHIFRNYESPYDILSHDETDSVRNNTPVTKPKDQLIWQAGRATGAAPTYFRASGQYLDGGLISNNPTLDTLTEIHQCNQALIATNQESKVFKIEAVVSLGTGRSPVVPVDQIDVFRPDSLWGACKMALGVTALGQLLVDQATQTDGRVTERTKAVCSMLQIPYIRLNPHLTENVALDETDTKILVKMLWETSAYMHGMKEELENLAKLLRP